MRKTISGSGTRISSSGGCMYSFTPERSPGLSPPPPPGPPPGLPSGRSFPRPPRPVFLGEKKTSNEQRTVVDNASADSSHPMNHSTVSLRYSGSLSSLSDLRGLLNDEDDASAANAAAAAAAAAATTTTVAAAVVVAGAVVVELAIVLDVVDVHVPRRNLILFSLLPFFFLYSLYSNFLIRLLLCSNQRISVCCSSLLVRLRRLGDRPGDGIHRRAKHLFTPGFTHFKTTNDQ